MRIRPHRQEGQIIVLFALAVIAMAASAALVFDIGNQLVQRRIAQNAADASALAGVQALGQGAKDGVIYDTIRTYVEGNSGPWTTPTAVTASCAVIPSMCVSKAYYMDATGIKLGTIPTTGAGTPPAGTTGILVEVTRVIPTTFAQVIGIRMLTAIGSATAFGVSGQLDVMLVLDTTGSMDLSGTNDFQHLKDAASSLITKLSPVVGGDVRLGIGRFAGIKCAYDNSGNYTVPCSDDLTLVTPLTDNAAVLQEIICGNASPGCTSYGTGQTSDCPSGMSGYACPVRDITYTYSGPGNCYYGFCPYYTGTKLPNAFRMLSTSSYYAWGSAGNGAGLGGALGGRNTNIPIGSTSNARKVLIMITDGQNELWNGQSGSSPLGTSVETTAMYDTNARSLTTALKKGADGVLGTSDDVEIFTVGFYCTPYSNQAPPASFCASPVADYPTNSSVHPCPGSTWPPAAVTPSATDTLLHDLSSSSATNCDHYYPIRKTEDLTILFNSIGARIQRPGLGH